MSILLKPSKCLSLESKKVKAVNILITGATGYIGSNLAIYLSLNKRFNIFALTRPTSDTKTLRSAENRIHIIQSDQTFEQINRAVKEASPNLVIHLAGVDAVEHRPDEIEPMIQSNILFGSHLLEAMVQNQVTYFINTGTFWEDMDGESEYRPMNLYAATKKAFSDILEYYQNAEQIKSIALKLYNVYGPHDPRGKIFSIFKKSIGQKQPIPFSPGEQILDHVYIDDVVLAYKQAIDYLIKKDNWEPETFSIGSGAGHKLKSIAKIYEDCIEKPLSIEWGGREYRKREIMFSQADIQPAKAAFNWTPKIDLKQGITKILETESSAYL